MLLTIQFPFADTRGFIPDETYRLDVPHWRLVRPGEEFVRSFGMVKLRGGGGLEDWVGEEVFCRADRALRFGDSLATLGPLLRGTRRRPSCAFRRLLYDGTAVTRLEVGIRFAPRRDTPSTPFRPAEFLSLLRGLLDLPVQVASQGTLRTEHALCRVAGPLSEHYLRSTTRRVEGKNPAVQSAWLIPARPLMILEYERGDFASLPADCRHVRVEEGSGIRLHYSSYPALRGRAPWGIWYLGTTSRSDPANVRKLRLHLFRLHAEKQCLREVLRAVGQRRLEIRARSPATDALQDYLNSAMRLLSRKSRFGLPQSALLIAAAQSEDAITPGERRTLLAELSRIRGNILRAVEQYTNAPAVPPSTFIQAGTMTHVSFGDNANFNGNLVIARTVQDAFNRVESSQAEQPLRETLHDLAGALATIAPLLSAQQSEEIARDMDALTSEVLSAAPRKRRYEISAEGLLEAARSLGQSAQPVIDAVGKVLALLP